MASPTLSIVMANMDGNDEYSRMAVELGAVGFVKKRDLTANALNSMLSGATGGQS